MCLPASPSARLAHATAAAAAAAAAAADAADALAGMAVELSESPRTLLPAKNSNAGSLTEQPLLAQEPLSLSTLNFGYGTYTELQNSLSEDDYREEGCELHDPESDLSDLSDADPFETNRLLSGASRARSVPCGCGTSSLKLADDDFVDSPPTTWGKPLNFLPSYVAVDLGSEPSSEDEAEEHAASTPAPFSATLHTASDVAAEAAYVAKAASRSGIQPLARWHGIAMLVVATLCVASQGTAVRLLPTVSGTLVACWLMQCQALVLLPLAIYQIAALPRARRADIFSDTDTLAFLPTAAVAWVVRAAGFFITAEHTALVRAWVFCNAHALLIAALALLARRRTSRLSHTELISATGVFLAISGVVVTQVPVLFGRGLTPFVSDLVALTCSVGPMIFLQMCHKLRAKMPLFTMMFPISLLSAVFFAVFAWTIGAADLSVTDHGLFGWAAPNRIAFGLYLGCIVGVLGHVTMVAALSAVSGVLVSVAQTLVPPIGTIVAVLIGMDSAPDLFTCVGIACMLIGALNIARASAVGGNAVEESEFV